MRRFLPLSATLAVLAAAFLALPARAQQPEPRPQCPPEEWPRDSVVSPNHGGLALFMAAFVFVPSATLLGPQGTCGVDEEPLYFVRPHGSVALGGGGYANNRRGGWAGSVRAEAVVGRVYGEVRLERYDLGGSVRLRAGRVGYLLHPVPSLAGGVTVGYREASIDEDALEGVEIAFPFFTVMGEDAKTGWFRWEPAYLITRSRVVWTPRLQIMLPVRGTPFVAGVDFEAKGMRGEDPIVGNLLVALRL